MDKVMAWFEGLSERGNIKGAQPLGGHGRRISGTDGRFVMDGPFTETKEAISFIASGSLANMSATIGVLMVPGDASGRARTPPLTTSHYSHQEQTHR
jgi:hypothetical protein